MNTVHCDRCRKEFIIEEFEGHDCFIATHSVQEIGIDSWFEGKIDGNGDKVLIVNGLNGILYRLVQCRHNPPHPNIRQTVFDSTNNKRRFDRTDLWFAYQHVISYFGRPSTSCTTDHQYSICSLDCIESARVSFCI